MLADAWVPLGAAPHGARRARMEASPQWGGRGFVNPEPMWNSLRLGLRAMLSVSEDAVPKAPLPVLEGDRRRFEAPSDLRITWLGHSTLLLEIDGATVLTDPIFGGRASPLDWAGPAVWYDPPIPLDDLPPLDAVLISHDHYDHLQTETIVALAARGARFVAPLGVGAHLTAWGVPPERVVELDWWDALPIGPITLTAVPARHASGRHLLDQNRTLWAGYALVGPRHRVYFSGDTGLFPGLAEIGRRLGPFDVTMLEVGAYDPAWPDWHLGPEQAVRAHRMVGGELLLPIHWGLWNLAAHGWTEPVERVLVEAERWRVATYVPRPGESLEPGALPPPRRWWPDLPWRTAAEQPVVATRVPPEDASPPGGTGG